MPYACSRLLSPLNFKSVQAEKLSQRVGDTGRWFLECQQIQEWIHGSAESACLWCPWQSLVISTNVFIAFFNLIHLFSGRRKDHPSLDYHRPFADASPPENTRPKASSVTTNLRLLKP